MTLASLLLSLATLLVLLLSVLVIVISSLLKSFGVKSVFLTIICRSWQILVISLLCRRNFLMTVLCIIMIRKLLKSKIAFLDITRLGLIIGINLIGSAVICVVMLQAVLMFGIMPIILTLILRTRRRSSIRTSSRRRLKTLTVRLPYSRIILISLSPILNSADRLRALCRSIVSLAWSIISRNMIPPFFWGDFIDIVFFFCYIVFGVDRHRLCLSEQKDSSQYRQAEIY